MMEELRKITDELDSIERKVQEQVNKTTGAGKEISEQVYQWLRESHDIKVDVRTHCLVDEKAKSIRKTRIFSCFSKSKKSYKDVLEKKSYENLLEKKTRVSDLVALGKSILCNSFPEDAKGIELVWRQGFVDFLSRKSAFDRIMEGLKDEEVGMIGVFGMGGIGKTKLVQEIGREAKKDKLFDQVVMATVSQNPTIKSIQGTLADMLGLQLKNISEVGRTLELRDRLMKERRVLVILDDVWDTIDIESIGIPSHSDNRGCKIVLTTRSEKVCNDMCCNLAEHLDVINDDEAWDLFSKYAGLHRKPGLVKKAKKIVSECAGLPLAIVTVGSALRDKSLDDYEDAARRLAKSSFVNVEGVEGVDIYSCIKLSYDYLDSEEAQKCFLLCSLYPEDSEILVEELTRYAYGWWLFQKVQSVDQARLIIIASIQTLENVCLLSLKNYLDPDCFLLRSCVKIHDIVRDAALWIANNEYGLFVWGPLKDFLNRKNNEKAFAVSVNSFDAESSLPNELKCGELKILRMQIASAVFPGDFFRKTSTLQVLDMQVVSQNKRPGDVIATFEVLLPVSLGNLGNLRFLRVTGENARNSDLSIVRKINNLEVLQLDGGPKVLPIWIGELCNLRLLDLSSWCELEEIPCNLLSRLTKLEELYTPIYPMKQSDYLGDLRFLPCLNVFTGWVSMKKQFPEEFCIKLLKRYVISNMDGKEFGMSKIGWSKVLGLYCENELSIKGFEQFLPDVECFQTMGPMHGIFNIYPQVDNTGLQNIRELILMFSANLKCLIDTTGTGQGLSSPVTVDILPNLVQLSLLCLPQLSRMFHGVPPLCYLGHLRRARIVSCPSLSNTVPNLLPVGPHLEELHLEYCASLKYVYEVEAEAFWTTENYTSLFPCPKKLRLINLRMLQSIWKVPYLLVKESCMDDDREVNSSIKEGKNGIHEAIFRSLNSLVDIGIEQCNELEEIFPLLEVDSWKYVGKLSNLVKLDLEGLPKLKCLFQSSHHNYSLQKLERIRICQCYNLTNLFTSSLAMSLVKLEEIEIIDCHALETIIVSDDQCMALRDLHGITLKRSFQEIKSIHIKSCKNLKSILPISIAVPGLPKLINISVEDCANIELVFGETEEIKAEGAEIIFKNLQSLELVNLPRLVSLLPLSWNLKIPPRLYLRIAASGQEERWELSRGVLPIEVLCILLGLRKLDIEGCYYNDVDQVFDVGEAQQPILTELEEVKVGHMPNLKFLWKGYSDFMSLCNLRQIKVHNCLSLQSLFPISVALNLPYLWQLSVEKCPKLELIFHDDGSSSKSSTLSTYQGAFKCKKFENIFDPGLVEDYDGPGRLPRCAIHLQELPCLLNICSPGYILNCQSYIEVTKVVIEKSKTTVLYSNAPIIEKAQPGLQIMKDPLILPSISSVCQLVNISFLTQITVLSLAYLSKNLFPQYVAKALSSLEILKVQYCEEFENLFEPSVDSISSSCFPKLRFLLVEGCENLKNLFPLSISCCLPRLKTVHIEDAEKLENIFFEDRKDLYEGYNVIELPTLKTMRLIELPSLNQICPAGYSLTCSDPTWSVLEVRPGFFVELPFVHVENINIEVLFDLGHTVLTKDYQQPLISHLHTLSLCNLSIFDCIWKGPSGSINLSNLKDITLQDCRMQQMKSLFTRTIVQSLHSLSELKVKNCKELENLIEPASDQDPTLQCNEDTSVVCFPQLGFIVLEVCDKLKSVLPLSVAQCLPKLKGIWVKGSYELEEVFTEDRGDVHTELKKFIRVPELNTLWLENLPMLSHICPPGYSLCCQTSLDCSQITDCPLMEQELCNILLVDRL